MVQPTTAQQVTQYQKSLFTLNQSITKPTILQLFVSNKNIPTPAMNTSTWLAPTQNLIIQ